MNLNVVASEGVATFAPWAVGYNRVIALNAAAEPVEVSGNAHSIAQSVCGGEAVARAK